MPLDISADLQAPGVVAWSVTDDFAIGAVRPPIGSIPTELCMIEAHNCFGLSEAPCEVEVEGVGSANVGPDIVRFHNVGDRIQSKSIADTEYADTWVVLSEEFTEAVLSDYAGVGLPSSRPFLHSFVSPALAELAALCAFLRRVELGSDPLWTAESLSILMGRLLGTREDKSPNSPSRRQRHLAQEADSLLIHSCLDAVSIGGLARQLGVTPPHLARCYRLVMGRSMYARLTSLRLGSAITRLAAGAASDLTELALDLGFASHSHFTAAFRRQVGMTPSGYRASCSI